MFHPALSYRAARTSSRRESGRPIMPGLFFFGSWRVLIARPTRVAIAAREALHRRRSSASVQEGHMALCHQTARCPSSAALNESHNNIRTATHLLNRHCRAALYLTTREERAVPKTCCLSRGIPTLAV